MHVPVSWLRDFVDTNAAAADIADALTSRGFTVDAVVEQPKPEKIVVGKIETLEPVPNSDKLRFGMVDVGSRKLQIVTGADNVAAGQKVPIALVGAVVFARGSSGETRETKTIVPAKLRGVESAGMMCSPDELALPGEHEDGILVLDADAPVGEDFWRAVRFGDAVLDVDVPSNRADCLSVIGLAREAAAGLRAPFRPPSWGPGAGPKPSPIGVEIGDSDVCRRLLGQLFTGIGNRQSPVWMALRLAAAHVRSLNFLIDVSNYVQIETGQPLHFYDARQIRGGKIAARGSRAGESVVTLDGVARPLAEGTPVITDGERIVGIAGIMGGAEAGIAADTVDVFLESPNFVGKRIRRASFALGLRTEGAIRHERNLPLELPEFGRRRAADLLIAAGATASAVVEAGQAPAAARSFSVRPSRVNALLGGANTAAQMRSSIESIGFGVQGDDPLQVTVPWWRPDVVEEVDVIEEVARGLGFDGIDERRAVAAPQSVDDSLFRQEQALANACAAMGYRETISIAVQGTKAIAAWERSGIDYWRSIVAIANPLSDDQRILRPSLLPGMLTQAARAWQRAGGTELRLFEIGHIFRTLDDGDRSNDRAVDGVFTEGGVLELPSLAGIAVFGAADETGAVDRHLLAVKGDAEHLVTRLCEGDVETKPHGRTYFHPAAAADLTFGGRTVAKFGRLHPRLAAAYELPETSYAFMLYMENLGHAKPVRHFEPLPKYPGTRRDLAVVVDEAVTAGQLMRAVRDAGVPAFESVAAFDEYTGPQVGSGKKSIALAVMLRRLDATITDDEADKSVDQIVQQLRETFGASLRG